MSEATVSITTKPIIEGVLDGRAKNVPGSAGILLPGYDVRLVRPDGSDAGINEPGELWLKGPTVTMGYWNNEKANKETFVDGWLKTGDMFMVDQDGVFYFQDRAKVRTFSVSIEMILWTDALLLGYTEGLRDASLAGGDREHVTRPSPQASRRRYRRGCIRWSNFRREGPTSMGRPQ